ncbi:protein air1-like [Zingiber officinale]|uniref:protein air1-like n=1 Tax=Zingiber officinale TaxID=94328 RepID=UPI001C4D7E25|nr:protein air1-like [Zingiber officinale]
MSRRSRSKRKPVPDDEEQPSQPITLFSSDDEANADLSIAIVEKARQRQAKRNKPVDAPFPAPVPASPPVIVLDISSASPSSGEAEFMSGRDTGSSVGGLLSPVDGKSMTRKKKSKKKQQQVEEDKEKELVGVIVSEEKPSIRDEEVINEANTSDNLVFRKLLRGPRYFDPEENKWVTPTCFNCGEEGHVAADCMLERRRKPCFFCGLFDHNSKQCSQGQDCYICKRRGHLAKVCPDKNKKIAQASEICLRCGGTTHTISSCRNDYSPDDLKEIQCYVCKKYGHLCCANLMDTSPREVFCYNCAQTGHTGLGCAKSRGYGTTDASPPTCYICNQEGHFARGCTKKTKLGESSTPRTSDKDKRWFRGSKSVPHDFGKRPKRDWVYEERWRTPTKTKIKGGWIVDDPGDLPRRRFGPTKYASPRTTVKRVRKNYLSGFGGHSSGSHGWKEWL